MLNSLPIQGQIGIEAREAEEPDADLFTAHILVVDDEKTIRTQIGEQLKASGFSNVRLVPDVHAALAAISLRLPELIISDLLMPQMNGFDFCRALRSEPKTRNIPVLAQTASTDPDLRALAFASGATDLFTKPYNPNELLCRVRILLQRGRLIDRLTEFRATMAEDLRHAAATQEALLPSAGRLAQIKAHSPLDVASFYKASVGLGGDIWGIEPLGGGRVSIYIADFAGHGVSAALNTVRLHSYISTGSGTHPLAPSEMLGRINRFLCAALPTGQYATMFAAVMDFNERRLDYASAAAPPQLLRTGADSPFMIIEAPGFPLGVTPDATFEDHSTRFEPGALLFMFSDALIETPEPPDSVFTPDSLRAFLDTIAPPCGPHRLRDQVLSHLISKISQKPADDLTLVAAHHLPPEREP